MPDTSADGFHDRVAAALALPAAANGDGFQARLTLAMAAIAAGVTTSPDGFIERLILTGLAVVSPPGAPILWFDAQNIDGTFNSSLVDGQALGTWLNGGSNGSGGNAVQATGGLRPTFKKVGSAGKINNLSSVLFTPTQWMQTANVASVAQPNVICAVCKPIAGNGTVADGNDGVNRNDLLFSGGTWQLFGGTALYNSTLAATAGVYHVLRALFNTTSSTIRANKTTSTAGTSPGAASLDGLSLGVAGDATTPMNGEIVEVIVYGAGTAPTDVLLDAYFDAKYGSSWPQ